MKKIELEQKKERKRRFTTLSAVIIGVTVVLSLIQLLFSNHLAAYGGELATLAKREKELSFENGMLVKKVASASAIVTISRKAKDLNFQTASNILVIEEKESLAKIGTNGF
jgi:hypothetical protein